jgi:hypothetical protein
MTRGFLKYGAFVIALSLPVAAYAAATGTAGANGATSGSSATGTAGANGASSGTGATAGANGTGTGGANSGNTGHMGANATGTPDNQTNTPQQQ